MTAACGGESSKSAASGARPADAGASLAPSPASTSTAPPAASAGPGGAADAGQLAVRQDNALGNVVTDGKGFTLYRFDDDVPNSSKSSCEGPCAQTWPPVMADGVKTAAGIEAGAVGRLQRSDGMQQLTLGGWPVYRYSKDTEAGQAKGQGVQGKWNALAPDGKKAAKAGGSGMPGMGMGGEGGKEGGGKDEGGKEGGGKEGGGKEGRGGEGGERGEPERSGEKGEQALKVIVVPVVGQIIADSWGRPLYLNGSGGRWSCGEGCRSSWRPARPVSPSRVRGIERDLIGQVRLSDGSYQLTVAGHAVFWYAGDRKSGEVSGQGRDNCWAIDARGNSTRPRGQSK
ncbi:MULTISPECIES: hypothetical protein [unclassified Streptomyces]|uniref:Lipoprotein n=1 Tax=Streptomyces sp. NBC_00060 TaxID=2975636 RepID=A0AAU2GUU6_9ACTN